MRLIFEIFCPICRGNMFRREFDSDPRWPRFKCLNPKCHTTFAIYDYDEDSVAGEPHRGLAGAAARSTRARSTPPNPSKQPHPKTELKRRNTTPRKVVKEPSGSA